ncbi:MAG: hypothetical protein AB1405_12135 [Bdellovibrionota bacterium]
MKDSSTNFDRVLLGALAFFCLFASACSTTIRRRADFLERRSSLKKVAIVPPVVSAVLIKGKDDYEPQPEVESELSSKFPGVYRMVLPEYGLGIAAGPEALAQADAEGLDAATIRFLYAVKTLYKRSSMSEKKALKYDFALGTDVRPLLEKTQSDVLLFTLLSSYEKSGKEIAKDWGFAFLLTAITLGHLVFIPAESDGSYLTIALAADSHGEILWSNRIENSKSGKAIKLEKLVREALEEFPEY